MQIFIHETVLLENKQEIFGEYDMKKDGWSNGVSLEVLSGDVQYLLRKALLRGFELGKEYACGTKEIPVQ